MNDDIRLSTTFFSNRKSKKLKNKIGSDGIIALLTLWTRVATEKPCGELTGWDEEDIAMEADYKGDPCEFVKILCSVGFLDVDDNGIYSLHNWKKRQGWVANSEERSNRGRLTRMAKTHHDIYKKLINEGCTGISREQYDKLIKVKLPVNETLTSGQQDADTALTPAPAPTPVPSPVPAPTPVPKKKKFGSLKNVFLSEKEYKKLSDKFNGTLTEKIENLSLYIASKGKKYKSHYATILAWDRRDKKESSQATQNTCQLCAKFCAPSSPDKCHKSATIKACKEFTAR